MPINHDKQVEAESFQAPTCLSKGYIGRAISDEEFGALFSTFQVSAWRLELLPQYLVDFSNPHFQAFVRGEPLPPHPQGEWWRKNEDWIDEVRSAIKAGKSFGRVHVLPERLTPYLRYEIEWGYCFNSQGGEDIRLLEAARVTPAMKAVFLQDYWIFDNQRVVLCDYDKDGGWRGARLLDAKEDILLYQSAQKLALEASVDLKTFLAKYRSGEYF